MHPDDRVWYATTQSKDGLTTDSRDIQTANHVTRRCDPTLPTAVRALSLVPLPAYRACLRGIRFVNLYRSAGFIIQLGNQPGIAGTADLLCLAPSQMLRGVVKGLAHIARGVRKRLNDFACGFVHQIVQTPTTLRQHPRFASLQPLPPSGTLRFVTLRLLQSPQMFVAGLNNGFRRATTDQESFLTIGGGNEGIDAQVNAKHGLLRHRYIRHLTD